MSPHPPNLLGVGGEEHLVQTAPEALAHPLLECLLGPMRTHGGRQIAAHRPRELERPELTDDVARVERVVQEATAVVDPRQAATDEELVTQDLVPEAFDLGALGEEPMPAQVEA